MPLELGQIFDGPQVISIVASLLTADGCVVERESYQLCNLLVSELDPTFSEVLFAVSSRPLSLLTRFRICEDVLVEETRMREGRDALTYSLDVERFDQLGQTVQIDVSLSLASYREGSCSNKVFLHGTGERASDPPP